MKSPVIMPVEEGAEILLQIWSNRDGSVPVIGEKCVAFVTRGKKWKECNSDENSLIWRLFSSKRLMLKSPKRTIFYFLKTVGSGLTCR